MRSKNGGIPESFHFPSLCTPLCRGLGGSTFLRVKHLVIVVIVVFFILDFILRSIPTTFFIVCQCLTLNLVDLILARQVKEQLIPWKQESRRE